MTKGCYEVALFCLEITLHKKALRANALKASTCRGGGIRTPGPREGSPVFKTGAINRSTTPLFNSVSFGSAKLNHNSV